MHGSSAGETADDVSASVGDWERVGGSSISASPRASRCDSEISDKGVRVSVLGVEAAASTGGSIFSLLCERVDKAGGGFERDRVKRGRAHTRDQGQLLDVQKKV